MGTALMETSQVGSGGEAMPQSELDELFAQAREGRIPRNRPLKPHEPLYLNETHFQIITLRAGGMRQTRIKDFLNNTMGTTLSDASVSIACNHPDAIYILNKMAARAGENVTDMRARIERYADEGLELTATIMRNTTDEKLATKIGFGFIDRAGYGAAQKLDVDVKHSVMAPAAAINNLAEAMRETSQEVPANFVMTGEQHLLGEGSGKSLVGSESAAESGLPLAVVPPHSASRNPIVRIKHPDYDEQDEKDSVEIRNAPKMRVA